MKNIPKLCLSPRNIRRGIFSKSLLPATAFFLGLSAPACQAHNIPRDYGSLNGSATTTSGEKTKLTSGHHGWIDAVYADFKDTQKLGTYTFTLNNQAVDLTLNFLGQSDASAGVGMTPGVGLHQGVTAFGANFGPGFSVSWDLFRTQVCGMGLGCTRSEASSRTLMVFASDMESDPAAIKPNIFTYLGLGHGGLTQSLPTQKQPLQNRDSLVVLGSDDTANKSVNIPFPNFAPVACIIFIGGTVYSNQSSLPHNTYDGIGAALPITSTAETIPVKIWQVNGVTTFYTGFRRQILLTG